MTLSPHGLAAATVFLALGVAELFVFMRAVYPVLSLRHETAKVTYSHGRSPAFITNIIRVQSLVGLPLLGYLAGVQLFSPGAH